MITTRRQFLQSTGAITVCFALPACKPGSETVVGSKISVGNRLQLMADGSVELALGKVELGQGIGTALAQMTAEELDVSFERIRLASVDTDYSPDESYTFSSISIQQSGPPTRQAAAAARDYLLQKAANRLGVAVDALTVIDGDVYVDKVLSDLSYWELLDDESTVLDVASERALKSPHEYTVVGQSYPRIDIPGKLFGDASFLQDVRLPNMVHARIVRPRAERAGIERFDASVVDGIVGVLKVIRDGEFVAVVAEREEQARRAATLLRSSTTWKYAGDMPKERAVYEWLTTAASKTESIADTQTVPADEVKTTKVAASYQRPYQAHASISPSAAIAQYDDDILTVWSHSQGIYPLRTAIAKVLKLEIEQVRCRHFEASGCYGHNGADDAACDAAAIAMHYPGKPVRLQWERADEMAWEPYGSAMLIEIDADVDDKGDVRGWNCDLWSTPHTSRPRNAENAGNLIYAQHKENPLPLPPVQSIPQPNGGADRNGIPLYAFETMQVTKHLVEDVPIRVSALRSLGAYANVFAIESFMDELAARTDVDPIDYRLRHLQDERAIALLKKLAELSDWYQRSSAESGQGWGLGFARFKNRSSYLGVVMQVAVDTATGRIRLSNATAVCDAGLVVNPDGVRAQIEGGIVQSCSWTLKEEIHFSNEQKQSLDWAAYPILRFDEIPDIEVALMQRDDQPALGVGETAQGPTAAAIANAVFDATGQRLRRLPLQLS